MRPVADPPKPPPPPRLVAWTDPRGHKLAFVALAPGSRIAVWCQSCKRWYEKEQAA